MRLFHGGEVHWGYRKQLTDGRKRQTWPNGRALKITNSVVGYISVRAQRSPCLEERGGDRYRGRTDHQNVSYCDISSACSWLTELFFIALNSTSAPIPFPPPLSHLSHAPQTNAYEVRTTKHPKLH